ncbi:hypothetical protein AADZ90_003785 [Aestuariibius sp. 2305UL40-4]|uniref:hypothetical protein n=1 Tax=Aestuariibius violaceus TaxID=3234132 RepID=UPI00345EFCD2
MIFDQLVEILIFDQFIIPLLTPLLLMYVATAMKTPLVRLTLIGIGILYLSAFSVRLALELDCSPTTLQNPQDCTVMPVAFWEALNGPTILALMTWPFVGVSAVAIGVFSDRFLRQRRKGAA